MTATLTSGLAQGDARQVNTKNGPRLVCDFRTRDGENVTLWKPTTDEVFATIKRNQKVQLIRDSKGWNLAVEDLPPAPLPQPVAAPSLPSDALPPDQKRAIAAYVEQLGDLYAFCHRTACNKLPDADPGVVGSAADALFRAACAKFNP